MSSGSSYDSRSYREEKGWYGNTNRTYDNGTKEVVSPGSYGQSNWKDSNGKSGVEWDSNGTTYRKDSDGNTSYR